jgi:hypothetical protein
LLSFYADYLGIYQRDSLRGILATGTIHYEEPLGHTDLRRCKTHPASLVHGLEHVFDQLFQLSIKVSYRFANLEQNRIGVANNIQKRHQ